MRPRRPGGSVRQTAPVAMPLCNRPFIFPGLDRAVPRATPGAWSDGTSRKQVMAPTVVRILGAALAALLGILGTSCSAPARQPRPTPTSGGSGCSPPSGGTDIAVLALTQRACPQQADAIVVRLSGPGVPASAGNLVGVTQFKALDETLSGQLWIPLRSLRPVVPRQFGEPEALGDLHRHRGVPGPPQSSQSTVCSRARSSSTGRAATRRSVPAPRSVRHRAQARTTRWRCRRRHPRVLHPPERPQPPWGRVGTPADGSRSVPPPRRGRPGDVTAGEATSAGATPVSSLRTSARTVEHPCAQLILSVWRRSAGRRRGLATVVRRPRRRAHAPVGRRDRVDATVTGAAAPPRRREGP